MNCATCRQSMPDLGFDTCATCSYGPEFSRTSVGASARVSAARGARKRETAAASVSARVGSPRRRRAEIIIHEALS
jgi:hypothetical protein